MISQPRTKRRLWTPFLLFVLALLAAVAVRLWPESVHQGSTETNIERRANALPNDLQAQLDWGNLLAQQGRIQESAKVFVDATQIAPRDPRPYSCLGALALQDHRPDYALANFLKSAQLNPSDAIVWHALGDLYAHAHKNNHAMDAYEHAVRLQPGDEVAWRQLGVLETESSLPARGYDALLRATTLNSGDLTAWIDLGNCALVTGHLPQAKQAFDRVLTSKPNDPTAILGDAEAAMQLDPTSNGLTNAEQMANRALALSQTPHTHLVLGRIALVRKDYTRAVSELKLAVDGNVKDLSAYGYLSQAYAGMGKPELARKASADYQREDAREHTPSDRGVRQNRKK